MFLGYTRVSTVEQASDDRTSLPEQARKIKACAEMQMDSPEVRIFSDPGVSGSLPLIDRPSGAQLLAAVNPGDTIVAAKLDRLFRSASDALASVERFHKQGVNVILLDISADPIASSGVGRMFFTIMAAVAEFEKFRIGERLKDGQRAKAAKGGYGGGGIPYGWRQVGRGPSAILAENENEQRVVALIRDLKTDGNRSLRQISSELSRRGIQNRVNKKFAPYQIKRIIDRAVTKEAAE